MDSVIIFLGKYLIFIVGLMSAFCVYQLKNRGLLILSFLLAGFLALGIATVADALYYNPRPFVEANIKPLFEHGPDNGFPSMHAVIAATLAGVAFFYHRKIGAVALLLSLLVGVGRVWAHVHAWIDIAGGFVFGLIAAYAGVVSAKYIFARINARQPKARR